MRMMDQKEEGWKRKGAHAFAKIYSKSISTKQNKTKLYKRMEEERGNGLRLCKD